MQEKALHLGYQFKSLATSICVGDTDQAEEKQTRHPLLPFAVTTMLTFCDKFI